MATTTSSSSSGIGVFGVLGVVFVVLKLMGIIHWSWWWVTLPFWGGLAILGVFLTTLGLIIAIGAAQKRSKIRARAVSRSAFDY